MAQEEAMGIVGGFAKPTVDAIGEGIAKFLKRQCSYLCCFTENINSLTKDADNLVRQRKDLQEKVTIEERNARRILNTVEAWLTDTGEIQRRREKIDDEIANSQNHCLNIRSRYSLSKKAKETDEAMKKLLIEYSKINSSSISLPPLPACEVPIALEKTFELQSRKDIEEDIVKLLASGPHIVGICGMGGVGKTTMADKIMHRMQTQKLKLFDEAVKVVVAERADLLEAQERATTTQKTPKVDMQKIQLALAEQLGLTDLKKLETSQERESRLRNRLTGKKILVVLDDIWRELKLKELGIPFDEGGSSGCSILLTSRHAEVLKNMDSQVFGMKTLDEREAWDLFKDKAGTCVDDNTDWVSIAQDVAKECKGLPVALVTVGSTLKDKGKPIWNNALSELRSSNPANLPKVLDEVYNPLRLSYTFLQNDAKLLFLLCSIFPDDFEISFDDLAFYSMGLQMFKGVDSLKKVRDRVDAIVEQLKSSFLLLDCDDKSKVKMHDLTRDVAIFIAKENRQLGCEGQFDINCEWISVFTSSTNELFDHLAESNFPTLRLLAIHQISLSRYDLKIGDISLLEGMQGLNVLSLRKSSFKSLGKAVKLPKNLRTLRLENCHLKTLSFAGALLNLEILSCYECNEIKELPSGIGKLKYLKLLDLSGCWRIERIEAGVIAELVKLEELKMLRSFKGWESSKVKEEDRRNVALKELESLQELRCLEIEIMDHELAKEEVRLSANIVKYAIFIGLGRDEFSPVKSEKVLSLRGFPRDTNFAEWIKKLVSSTDEELYLEGEGSINLDISQVYNKIKRLEIERCGISSVMDLVRSPTQNANASFGGLCRIQIEKCHKLRNLSWLQRGNDGILLPQLERLHIEDCEMMEEIVVLENEENNNGNISGSGSIIIFSKLVELRLNNMPKLTAVVRGAAETIQFPLLEKLRIDDCPKLKSIEYPMESDGRRIHNYDDGSLHLFCSKRVNFGGLKKLKVAGYNDEEVVVNNIWCSQISSCFFQTLETLKINRCDKLSSLFAPSIVKNLVNLNDLYIRKCKNLKEVVAGVEKEREEFCGEINGPIQQQQCYYSNTNKDDCGEMGGVIVIFPKLKAMLLYDLPRLRGVGKGIQGIEFPILRDLYIEDCPKLRNSIWSTRSECVDNHNHHDDDEALHLFCHHKVKFDALNYLTIEGVGNVSSLWCPEIPQHFFRALEFVSIKGCQNIKNLFSSSIVENLVNLNELGIFNCEKMEEVIKIDKARDEISKENYGRIEEEENGDNGDGAAGNTRRITFPTLSRLWLWHLSNLTCLGKGMESIEFPMLKELEIRSCQELIGMVVGSWKSKNNNNEEKEEEQKQKNDENSHLLCNHKVKFSALESIELYNCNNLRSLFSCTTVENLINFKRLSISKCKQMEKVITGDSEIYRSSMLFPSLESIEFEGLQSLKMLCAWNGALEWPFLERISIQRCPKMEFLTPGSISSPKLYEISVDNKVFEEEEWNEMKDLNRFIHHHIVSTREESTKPVVEHGETSTNKMMEIEEIDEDEHT